MEIHVSQAPSAHVIRLSGRWDAFSSPAFEQSCSELIGQDMRNVVLDLSGVDYVSSFGLRGLLNKGGVPRAFITDFPVLGIAAGYGGKTWLFRTHNGAIDREELEDLTPLVSPAGEPPRWRSLLHSFPENGPHAAMLYAEPLSGDPQDGWAGLVLIMPWIRNTLYELSRFSNAAPFFINRTRAVHHLSAGQASREGPQSLSDEARLSGATKLASLEKAILDGGSGVVQLRPIFNGDRLPWPLPWDGPTSLAYAPLREQGWHLGLLVSSRELGDAPHGLPLPFLLVAILGPLFIVLLTWMATSRTLRPLRALTAAIDRLGEGDLDTPFPRSPFPDEVGGMLDAFERVRVTLRGSFRNLVDSAAAQQRLSNELAIARKIQKSMLPRAFPETPGARLRASIDMAREVCGDLYECFADPARLCFVMGDVCGKGVPAAPSRSGFRRRGRPPAVDRGTRARRPGGATVFDVHAGTRAGTVRAAVHGRRGRSHRPARHRGRRTLRRRASCRVLLNGKAVALSEEEFPLQPVRNAALRFMTVGKDHAKERGLADRLPQRVRLLHCGSGADVAFFPCSGPVDDAPLLRAVQTGEKAPETLDGPLQRPLVAVGGGHDEEKRLVPDFGIAGHRPVDQRLHLGGHRVEIHRRRHDDHVGGDHLVQNVRHVVFPHADAALLTGLAAEAIADRPVPQENLLRPVAGFLRAQQELVAQQIGIAALSWAGGQYQYVFAH